MWHDNKISKSHSRYKTRYKNMKANYATKLKYIITLKKLSNHIINNISTDLKKLYYELINQQYPSNKTQAEILSEFINTHIELYQRKVDVLAPKLAKEYVERTDQNVKRGIKLFLSALPIYLVKELESSMERKNQAVINSKEVLIAENINIISGIPQKIKNDMIRHTMETLTKGYNEKHLSSKLKEIKASSDKRIKVIAGYQISKMTSLINRTIQLSLGIKKNVWKHGNPKHPRISHLRADGRVYDLEIGCLIDGEYIHPAELINCTCYSIPKLEFFI